MQLTEARLYGVEMPAGTRRSPTLSI
jgi:hypothetical protein